MDDRKIFHFFTEGKTLSVVLGVACQQRNLGLPDNLAVRLASKKNV